jgi:hypothetical protein
MVSTRTIDEAGEIVEITPASDIVQRFFRKYPWFGLFYYNR